MVRQILALLPQTQCTRCGYPDCAAYASAIADEAAPINQCPPGGAEGIARLAKLTGQPATDLNPENGAESARTVAIIDEAWCIGCTLCIDACPVDAIVGTNKMMHTVIEPHCTGCELCLPVCPVDCIALETASLPGTTGWDAWSPQLADVAARRYTLHSNRISKDGVNRTFLPPNTVESGVLDAGAGPADNPRSAVVAAAVARARAQALKR
jgi:Na+-translocating ferredoxin:NAD+ oxidoreductase subunit B